MPKKKTPSYTSYEVFVKDLMESLIRLEGKDFRNVVVEHNVRIRGISGVLRQIDVYWEFEFAGAIYRNVIQAKEWNSKITLGTIDTLYSVIRDIPGSPKGYLITTVGFQSGAIDYAKTHGIELYKLYELSDNDKKELKIGDPPIIDAFWCSVSHIAIMTTAPVSDDFRRLACAAIESDHLELEMLDSSDKQKFSELIEKSRQMPREGFWNSIIEFQEPIRLTVPAGHHMLTTGITITWSYERMAPTMQMGNVITHLFGTATGETAFLVDANMQLKRLGEPIEYSSPPIDTEPYRSRPSQTRISFLVAESDLLTNVDE
ncbi:MAG: hypothetical protein GC193_10605 [Cryomorphaceae bacterium]|nr:hypothetical protein [Cryomorphaceae bacterium]